MGTVVAVDSIAARILLLRGQRVIIDADLAALYGVPTKRLNEQVKRNAQRFPPDFLFPLTATEKAKVVANCDHLSTLKFSKTLPFAFTEHGALMAASVLKPSARSRSRSTSCAPSCNCASSSPATRNSRAGSISWNSTSNASSPPTMAIAGILDALRQLMAPPPASKRGIGFVIPEGRKKS